eukprot:scaffold127377_cov75-Phaeocystis_antarctica.AAC.5
MGIGQDRTTTYGRSPASKPCHNTPSSAEPPTQLEYKQPMAQVATHSSIRALLLRNSGMLFAGTSLLFRAHSIALLTKYCHACIVPGSSSNAWGTL